MKQIKATFFSDPSHGWLAVKRKLLSELDILSEISSCSYQKGNTVYLEEDCDVSLLAKTIKEKYDQKLDEFFDIKYSNTNGQSPVRYYFRFSK